MEESLFEGKEPEVKAIYIAIKRAVNELDAVKFETKKTSIHVVFELDSFNIIYFQ